MPKLVGRTLAGRYRVEEEIGRGGMAEVYKVWDTQRSVYLAMKLLREDLADDKVFMRRFQREAKTLAKLQHPNIVRFYGLDEHRYLAFILMDYVDGESLRREIRKAGGPMPAARAAEIMKAICAALGYAHNQGMVHCDIKPGNVMIHKNGTVLVTDFGIARMTDAATATMVGFGTPAYMAPELVRGKEPTPQTDIYALGVMLFEMLTGGERPFTGERAEIAGSTSDKVRWEQVNLMPPLPRRWNKAISEQLEEVVLKCLAKQPEKRFGSVIELMNALSRAIGAEVTAIEEEAPAKPAPAAKRRPPKVKPKPNEVPSREERAAGPRLPRWAWVAGVGGIAVTTLVIVGLSLGGGSQEQATQVAQSVPTITEAPIEPTQPSTAGLDIGSTMVSPVDEATLVYVPEGTFEMGGGGGIYAEDDENPQHQVYLDGFWIDQTEVTNAMFAAFLNAEGNQKEGGVSWLDDSEPDVRIHMQTGSWQVDAGYERHPVIEVSWYGARAYCEWADRRLPTEAEWEKASRGTEGQLYPWGDAQWDCDKAQYAFCEGGTLPVGGKPAGESPYGTLDMAGNVWEWVADWYDPEYYDVSETSNPLGPDNGDLRVLRGGSWAVHPAYGRAASRHALAPEETGGALGFRCASSP